MNNLWYKAIFSFCLYSCGTILGFITSHRSLAFSLGKDNAKPELSDSGQTKDLCKAMGSNFQQFYNFETRNYHIGICRQDEEWFYFRRPKSNLEDTLFLSAKLVFGGDVFRAENGRITYFVGVNSDGYYSSVMYGNNQMIFEPQIVKDSSLAQEQESVKSSLLIYEAETANRQNIPPEQDYWNICTEDPNDAHPYLHGWQKFIGESQRNINQYISNKGHILKPANSDKEDISIETKDGLMVTLDVVRKSETVAGVCVQPLASF